MKKVVLFLLSLGFIISSCTKEKIVEKPVIKEVVKEVIVEKPVVKEVVIEKPCENKVKEVSLNVEYEPFFRGKIYPSLYYSLAGKESFNNKVFTVTLNSNDDVKVKLEMIENDFTSYKELIIDLKKGDNEVKIDVPWKYSDFRNLTKAGFTYFKFRVLEQETDKFLNAFDLKLEHRSINECVYAIKDLHTNENYSHSYLFTSYVNEDSPVIDKFLSETLKNSQNKYRVDDWSGYQKNAKGVLQEIACVVYELYLRGMKYSNITDTSNSNNGIYSQYIRFIEDSISLTQANCVDGSVLVASILEKIGIDCELIMVPGHMYVRAYLDKKHSDFYLIETTAISTGDKYQIFLTTDQKAGDFEHYNEMLNSQNGYSLIDIKYVRQLGYKPIQ